MAALGLGPQDLIDDLNTFGLLFETMCIRDLRVFADGAFRVLDRNEYNYHKRIMKYPYEINEIIKYELTSLINMKRSGVPPFDPKVIDYYFKIYQKISK